MAYQLEKLTIARLKHAFTRCDTVEIKSNTTGFFYKTYDRWEGYNIEINGEILPEHECLSTPEEVLSEMQKYDESMKWWQETIGIRDLK